MVLMNMKNFNLFSRFAFLNSLKLTRKCPTTFPIIVLQFFASFTYFFSFNHIIFIIFYLSLIS